MSGGPVGVGVIGAGVISSAYLDNLVRFPDVRVLFIADLDHERAAAQAAKYGVERSGSVAELLAIDEIEIVVNLTIPAAHVEVGLQILAAGKHVWAEKPFALDRESGAALLDAATAAGLRVASAPDTFLGAGLQTARRIVDAGTIGDPLTAVAQFRSTGPESWHPSPEFLFAHGAGPLFDMGPYYLTALVQLFGPVARVTATSSTSRTTRVIGSGPKAGTEFPVEVPTHHAALLEFESGASAQTVFSFQSLRSHPALIEVSGSEGTIDLPDPNNFDGSTHVWTDDPTTGTEVEATGNTYGRGTGVVELARAIRSGVPERANATQAFHVLDVMVSIAESASSGRTVEVASTSERPPILPDDWDAAASTLN
jgi:predicted dehydrogenase